MHRIVISAKHVKEAIYSIKWSRLKVFFLTKINLKRFKIKFTQINYPFYCINNCWVLKGKNTPSILKRGGVWVLVLCFLLNRTEIPQRSGIFVESTLHAWSTWTHLLRQITGHNWRQWFWLSPSSFFWVTKTNLSCYQVTSFCIWFAYIRGKLRTPKERKILIR